MTVDFRDLKFGIEIEMTRRTREEVAEAIGDFFGACPVESRRGVDSYVIEDAQLRTWNVVNDSSIFSQMRGNDGRLIQAGEEYKVELVSPILGYGDIPVLQELIRHLRKSGCGTNTSTGIHIHVSADLFDTEALRRLCNIIYSKQKLLGQSLLVAHTRKRYCEDLSGDFIEKLNKAKPKTIDEFADIWYDSSNNWMYERRSRYNDSRYKILNLHNLLSERHQAIEYRLFNAVLHAGVVKSEIQLALLIAAQALNQKRASAIATSTRNPKYSYRVWLLRLGAIGDEFKTLRYHLVKHMHGSASSSKGDYTNLPWF